MDSNVDDLLHFNGINGVTGNYLMPPLSPDVIVAMARGEKVDEKHLSELKWWYSYTTQATFGPREGIDPKKLEQTGWGVIFPYSLGEQRQQEICEALNPLFEHRRQQATQAHPNYYKKYVGVDALRPDESKQDFLARHGAGPGPADPENVPYYILLVGDPEMISYRFQYQLDIQYAVGRIWFETLEEFRRYANSVVASETQQISSSRSIAFFGVQNDDDKATNLSANELVLPLARKTAQRYPEWKVQTAVKDQATKAQLARFLGGMETPALLFTASHGMGFPKGHPSQKDHQGALLCQDWPGPNAWQAAIPTDFYFSADDISQNANVAGLITFHFACFGAGTPHLDDFAHQAFLTQTEIADSAFLARLPCRLLSLEAGALAVIGHVERAWGYSFLWGQAGRQIQTFEDTLRRLIEGHPVGSAIEPFNQRYSEVAADLSEALERLKFGGHVDAYSLAGMWTANNDARSYVVIGDPAVRLPANV